MKETIDEILARAVQHGHAPNLVAVVAAPDRVLYEGGVGRRDPEHDDTVSVDTMYRLASMTKIITTTAALQLIAQHRIELDQPVADFVPEFAGLQVLERMDGETPVLRPPVSQATVRHLLTHTSGLTYWIWSPAVRAWEQATGTPNVLTGDARALTAPLVADPGSRFEYGTSTDYLGKVVEQASGQDLPAYLLDNVTGPLSMTSTTFRPDDEQRASLVPVYVPDGQGGWVATPTDWSTKPDWWAGGHALYSTPRDFTRFQRMLLRGGELDGVRVLAEDTVRDAFTPQIGELDTPEAVATADPLYSCDLVYGPDRTWGWGLLLNRTQEPDLRAPLSGAWAGLANTHFWVDRTKGVAGALYTQFLPFMIPALMNVYEDIERAVYANS